MSYSIPDCFMLAFVCGFVFGLVYEALRIVRLVLRFKAAVFICDIAFFALAAELVFKLSLILGNYIRIYTLLGFGAGVFAYIVTIGRVLNLLESAAAIVWRKTIGRLARKIAEKIKGAVGAFAHIIKSYFGKVADFFGRLQKISAKHLHLRHEKLYNNNVTNENKGSEVSHVIQAKIRRSP